MELAQLGKRLLIKELDSIPLVNYEPAVLKEWPTGWQVEYRILNPDSGFLEKKRIRFEKIRKRLGSDTKARKFAKIYCDKITEKLESGWNPYTEGKNVKAFHKLTDAIKSYITEKEVDLKNEVFSIDSMRSYRSQMKMFSDWLFKTKRGELLVGAFTKEMAQQYLDYVYMEKKLSPYTWNNYLKYMRTFWNWLIEKSYCSENILGKIKPKPINEKIRVSYRLNGRRKSLNIIGFIIRSWSWSVGWFIIPLCVRQKYAGHK